jgi:5-methylcytosine-specific restriction enzyme A
MKAPSICAEPGCPVIVEKGSRCPKHRAKDKRRPQMSERGYPPDWRKKRAKFLKDHPWCECDACSLTFPKSARPIATHVDHIVDVKHGGSHDPSNLRAMSHSHHSKRTGRDSPGGWNSFAQRDRLRAGRPSDRPNPGRDQRRTGG